MTIEITLVISIISVSAAVFFGIKSNKRASDADTIQRARENQRILDSLAEISRTIERIAAELASSTAMVNDHDTRIFMLENGLKQTVNQINDIVERLRSLEKQKPSGET